MKPVRSVFISEIIFPVLQFLAKTVPRQFPRALPVVNIPAPGKNGLKAAFSMRSGRRGARIRRPAEALYALYFQGGPRYNSCRAFRQPGPCGTVPEARASGFPSRILPALQHPLPVPAAASFPSPPPSPDRNGAARGLADAAPACGSCTGPASRQAPFHRARRLPGRPSAPLPRSAACRPAGAARAFLRAAPDLRAGRAPQEEAGTRRRLAGRSIRLTVQIET
jgi:hypothetical protein